LHRRSVGAVIGVAAVPLTFSQDGQTATAQLLRLLEGHIDLVAVGTTRVAKATLVAPWSSLVRFKTMPFDAFRGPGPAGGTR